MSRATNNLIEQLQEEISSIESRLSISEEGLNHLRKIYEVAFIEGSYDPFNKSSYEAAVQIWPHIKALNEELRFRK